MEASLENLDEYSLLNIFDLLHFEDLVNVAAVQPRLHHVIRNYYAIHKYHLHEKTILIDFLNENYQVMHKETDQELINSYAGVLQLFRQFGSLIKHLEISRFLCNEEKSIEIFQHIGKHCNDSLETLTVTLYHKFLYDNLSLPQMTALSFRQIDVDCDISFLKSTVQLNPQLRRIHITRRLDIAFMAFLAESLPELEELTVASFPDDFTDNVNMVNISFARVKHFQMNWYNYEKRTPELDPFPLHFNQLDTLELQATHIRPKLYQFIMRHKHMKRLLLPWIIIDIDELNALIDELNELIEIKLKLTNAMSADELIGGLNRSHTLRYFTILVDLDTTDVQQLLDTVLYDSQWKRVNKNDSSEGDNQLSFERR